MAAAEGAADEAPLIDAAVGGDARAFAALYDRYVDRVYRHARYRVGGRVEAEDLTQQVFLNAWRGIGRYRRTGAPFAAWLFGIAHNLILVHYRRSRALDELDADLAATVRWADPEAEAMVGDDRAAVRRAITRLKPTQQQVVIMRFVEDVEYAAIAAAIGKSEGNVRVIAHRALIELRRLLQHQVDGR